MAMDMRLPYCPVCPFALLPPAERRVWRGTWPRQPGLATCHATRAAEWPPSLRVCLHCVPRRGWCGCGLVSRAPPPFLSSLCWLPFHNARPALLSPFPPLFCSRLALAALHTPGARISALSPLPIARALVCSRSGWSQQDRDRDRERAPQHRVVPCGTTIRLRWGRAPARLLVASCAHMQQVHAEGTVLACATC